MESSRKTIAEESMRSLSTILGTGLSKEVVKIVAELIEMGVDATSIAEGKLILSKLIKLIDVFILSSLSFY